MSSGVSQKETRVHVVNIAIAMSLAEMPKITNRAKPCFLIRACAERNSDGKQVPETVDPTCKVIFLFLKIACSFHVLLLGGGGGHQLTPSGDLSRAVPSLNFFIVSLFFIRIVWVHSVVY
jgi:hypothetical protein